jgi:hypothetical protein
MTGSVLVAINVHDKQTVRRFGAPKEDQVS